MIFEREGGEGEQNTKNIVTAVKEDTSSIIETILSLPGKQPCSEAAALPLPGPGPSHLPQPLTQLPLLPALPLLSLLPRHLGLVPQLPERAGPLHHPPLPHHPSPWLQ